MASKAALAEVTNRPSATQNRDGSLTTQRSTVRRPHSVVRQVTLQQPAPLLTTSSASLTTGMRALSIVQHRIVKTTAGQNAKAHTGNNGQKPNAPRPPLVTTSRSSWLKATPPSSTFPSAKPPASVTTNGLKQQQQQQQQAEARRAAKPPPAPRLPPGARQQTMVRPPRTTHPTGAETALLKRSLRPQSSRLSVYTDQDMSMVTPKVATRTVTTARRAVVSNASSKPLVSTASTSSSTARSNMRIPIPPPQQQRHRERRGPAAPSNTASASTEHLPAPRKRELIIPAVPMFDSELFLDVDIEMVDKDGSARHRRTLSDNLAVDMMSMDMSSEDASRTNGGYNGHSNEDDNDEYDPDPVFVSEYQADIFAYKRELEIKLMPDPDFMDRQPELTWHYRVHLIEWLIQVHERFGLLQETLHLCVNYLDRFLSRMVITVDKLQLAGIVALLLASKYEEIQSPSIQTLVELASHQYTAEQVRSAEIQMLRALQYDMGHPGPMSFLRRISRVDGYDVDLRTMAKYLVDVTLCDHRFVVVPSSMVAAIAYRTSMLLLLDRAKGCWTDQHERWSGYAESTLAAGVNVLLNMLERPELTHPVLFEKYQDPQLLSPSTYVHGLGVELLCALRL
ncbi:hypothetical protein DFQ26_005746 [Actinomortierella ambigua]|nr:hypothetical protein DFQ26_005746 [Actinomortierella ambigua]